MIVINSGWRDVTDRRRHVVHRSDRRATSCDRHRRYVTAVSMLLLRRLLLLDDTVTLKMIERWRSLIR